MVRKSNSKKIEVKGIKKALLFFHDPKTGLNRTVTFGGIEEMLDLFYEASEMWFERTQKLVKETYGKDLTKKEWLEMMEGTKPDWITGNGYEVGEDISLNLKYWISKK